MTIAYKTHSTIFFMINETPLVAVAYHPKSIEFMEKIGIEHYAIRDEEASSDKLIELVDKLVENYDEVVKKRLMVSIKTELKLAHI